MALNSYSALKDSVAAWLNEVDLVTRIPDFIALAEAVINRRVDHRLMTGVTTLGFVGGRVVLPGDFRAVKAVRTEAGALTFVTPAAGVGHRQYSIAGRHMLADPAVETAVLIYGRQVEPLAENGENGLLDAFPDVYLYGTLSQAGPYVEDADRAATWSQLFEKALSEINADGQAQSFGGTLQTDHGQARTF